MADAAGDPAGCHHSDQQTTIARLRLYTTPPDPVCRLSIESVEADAAPTINRRIEPNGNNHGDSTESLGRYFRVEMNLFSRLMRGIGAIRREQRYAHDRNTRDFVLFIVKNRS